MHEYIIRERQIELCFEGDRYFTTRRLWKAHTPDKIVTDPVTGEEKDGRIYGDGGSMWGMNVDAGDVGSNDFNFEGFYKRAVFEERKFNKEYYLFPIPQKKWISVRDWFRIHGGVEILLINKKVYSYEENIFIRNTRYICKYVNADFL